MKKVLFLIGAMLVLFGNIKATDVRYQVNDQKVDELFANATESSFTDVNTSNLFNVNGGAKFSGNAPDPAVATILAFLVGEFGIHRLYLGTETGTFLAYLFTLGGCGIISLVDFIVLIVGLVEEDVSKYIDNPKFIMWAN